MKRAADIIRARNYDLSVLETMDTGKPLSEMFDVISDSMPEDNPGGLKKEEYADVIAYLLKLNNFPTGESELPIDKDALSAILMEKPVSP